MAMIFAGCAPTTIAVMSQEEVLGQALSARNGYFVPLEPAAALVGATVVSSPLSLSFADGSHILVQEKVEDIIIRQEKVYLRQEVLPHLLGVEARVERGVIRLLPLSPQIHLSVTPMGITLQASSALHYTAEWRTDTEFHITTPCRELVGNIGELALEGSIFNRVEVNYDDSVLSIVFFGQYAEGWRPKLGFTGSRASAEVTWPLSLPKPAVYTQDGRQVLELTVGEKNHVRILDLPELKSVPVVRLRQRTDMVMGPEAYFPPVRQGLTSGLEGPLLAFTPGWVKTVINGYEGWVPERSVQLQLQTPAYPLSLRNSPDIRSEAIGQIAPQTEIVLTEKVVGGYLVHVVSSQQQGYLLDGQLFLESMLHLPKAGLIKVARIAIKDMLPPQELVSGEFFRVVDAVMHQGETILTIEVESHMNVSIERQKSTAKVLAGVSLKQLTLNEVPSGIQLGFDADGAFDIVAKRTAGGLQFTLPYAALHVEFELPQFKSPIKGLSTVQLPNGVEIQVELLQPLAYRIFDSRLVTILSRGLTGKTIVIDPGHGGRDPGAVGKLGWDEKDYTLDIAKRLAKELEAQGAVAILTHQGVQQDRKVLAEERLMWINKPETDLFLSIHLNAFIQSNQRGAETYYYHGEENFRLAKAMQAAMVRAGMRNRSTIYSRTLALLRRGQPPGVLLEVGFISSPDDEKHLSLEQNRQRMAVELAQGVAEYFGH